jgi:hypothetical protein
LSSYISFSDSAPSFFFSSSIMSSQTHKVERPACWPGAKSRETN